jgi:hypothetical protein
MGPVRALSISLALLLLACGRTEPVRWTIELDPNTGLPLGDDAGVQPCTAAAVDTYVIPKMDRRPIDVLFVIDDSCSMDNDQRQLGANMRSFFSTFLSNQVDFHVGVVTTDMTDPARRGRLVAPFLTHTTPNVTVNFQSMVMVGIGGSGVEKGLAAASAALRPPISNNENAGFLRPDADFALVFLTDEDDSSAQSVTFIANQVKAVKPDGAAMTVGSILLGCAGTESWRYAQFTRMFGDRGIITRCTQNYATTLRTIAGRVVNKRCIVGLREPLDDTKEISATLNGAPATFQEFAPDDAFPNGSLEVDPCPESGGVFDLTWSLCKP